MIYVSTSCVRFNKISESAAFLAENGFKNIELSGGTSYYPEFENDLLELQAKYNLNYTVHNYFPPPKKHFVLNLASLNDHIFSDSLEHYKSAIRLSRKLKSNKIGIHAGYFIDPGTDELGRKISVRKISDKERSISRFCSGYKSLLEYAGETKVYVENNVVSGFNFAEFGENPFMLTCYQEYEELQLKIKFPLILDLAHLNVSCTTLNLDYNDEVNKLIANSDYIHISHNNGKADSNQPLSKDSKIFKILNKYQLKEKSITLEIYDHIDEIKKSFKLLNEV